MQRYEQQRALFKSSLISSQAPSDAFKCVHCFTNQGRSRLYISLFTRAGGQLYIYTAGQPIVIRRIHFSLPAADAQRTRCDARLLGCQTQRDASHARGNHSGEQLRRC